MVYCNFIEQSKGKIVYAIGGFPDDITGRLEIDLSDNSFEVTAPPKNSRVYDRHIASMLRKHLSELANGDYKQKMSYEIG